MLASLETPNNRILAQLSDADWSMLRADAEYVHVPARTTLARPGDDVSTVYFPECGLVSVVSTTTTGHHVEVAAIGHEGLVGAAAILNVQKWPYWLVGQIDSHGYRIPAEQFLEHFHAVIGLRHITLDYVGKLLQELGRSAACNRFHSHQERLARWLLVTAERSGHDALELTHEFIAQMVGGPRHAVTAALNELQEHGTIACIRGRVEIVDAEQLVTYACECYPRRRR